MKESGEMVENSTVDCESVGGNFLYSMRRRGLCDFFSPQFFDKSKTDEFVLDMTLKKLPGQRERESSRHVCAAGVDIAIASPILVLYIYIPRFLCALI